MTESIQRIVLASRPDGAPCSENFTLEQVPMPALADGQFLVRVIYLSLDPYMRGRMDDAKSYAPPVAIGGVMVGGAVAEVVDSKHAGFAAGDLVVGSFGWCSHAVSDGDGVRKIDPHLAPISTALGVLGMPGFTAYVGLKLHGRPQPGETLVVGAATGAVGSVVGQLAKLQGLRVVGVAGGAEKCALAVEAFGFDACLDHRAPEFEEQLARACPDGVDVYFENVGGRTLKAVLPLMNQSGRIPVCGMISWYNDGALGQGALDDPGALPRLWGTILVRRLAVTGFIVSDHVGHFGDFAREVGAHFRDGRISYRETITDGLEHAPEAFIALFRGANVGKQLVRVSDEPTA